MFTLEVGVPREFGLGLARETSLVQLVMLCYYFAARFSYFQKKLVVPANWTIIMLCYVTFNIFTGKKRLGIHFRQLKL